MIRYALNLFFVLCCSCVIAQQQVTNEKNKLGRCGIDASFIRMCGDSSAVRMLTGRYESAANNTAMLSCGRFNLVFEDVQLSNGIGFDDPTYGSAFQTCACNVFTYIQSVFDIPAGDGSPIEIMVNQSWHWTTTAPPDPNIIATGGPIYSGSNFIAGTAGFYGGNVFDHMTTGNDPDHSSIDGQITFNFNFPLHLCGNYDCNSMDFYSVMLHEVTHMMGWGSSLQENSGTPFPESIFGNNQYTVYDKYFLYYGNIKTGPMLHVVNAVNLSAPFIDPAIPAGALTSGMIWMDAAVQYDTVLNPNNPVYSFSNFTTNSSPPNTISHFSDCQGCFESMSSVAPGLMLDYSMGPLFYFGQTRDKYSLQELRALNKMGYNFSASFSSSTSLNPAFANTVILANHHPFTTKMVYEPTWYYTGPYILSELDLNSYSPADYTINNCGSVIIDLSTDARLKDADGDAIRIFPGSLYNIRGCGIGGNNHNALSVNSAPGGDILTYTPRSDFIGRAQFGFNLWDGKEKGAFMFYTIDVSGCNSCDSDLVVNGDFEEGAEVITPAHMANAGSMRSYYRNPYFNPGFNRIFPDGQVFTNYASCLVRSSTGCIDTFTAYGHSYYSFDTPGGGPSANAASYGDRYFNLYDGTNYFRLCSSPQNCTRYILEFDYSTTSSNSITFGLINAPLPGGGETMLAQVSTPLTDTSGAWTHVSVPVNYCSSTASTFLGAFLPVFSQVYIDNIRLYADPSPPTFSISVTPDSASASPGMPAVLTANVNNPMCNLTYNWLPGALSGASVSVSPSASTTYTVVVSDGCSVASDYAYVGVTTTGVHLQNDFENFNVFPNPGNGVFFLYAEIFSKTNITIEIENPLGQTVYRKTLNGAAGKLSELIDITGAASGIYFLRVKTTGSFTSKKLIKD